MTDPSLYNIVVRTLPKSVDELTTAPCTVCGCPQARPTYSLDQFDLQIVVCNRCGTGRLHPPPTPEQIAGFYPPLYYGSTGRKFNRWIEPLVRFVAARHVRFLSRRIRPGGRVLDVGCGRGTLLSSLAKRGFETHGVEVSRHAAEGADRRAEVRIAATLPEAGYPDDWFDLVIYWHVFEHLSDPRAALEEVRRILRPGGHVVIAVPNFSSWQARWAGAAWFHLDPPRHITHFPLPALKSLLTDCGFHCTSEHHFSLRQNPFGWVQSWLNRSNHLPRNALYELLHRRKERSAALTRTARVCQFAAFALGMPVALAVECVAIACRSGATVHVAATVEK